MKNKGERERGREIERRKEGKKGGKRKKKQLLELERKEKKNISNEPHCCYSLVSNYGLRSRARIERERTSEKNRNQNGLKKVNKNLDD